MCSFMCKIHLKHCKVNCLKYISRKKREIAKYIVKTLYSSGEKIILAETNDKNVRNKKIQNLPFIDF